MQTVSRLFFHRAAATLAVVDKAGGRGRVRGGRVIAQRDSTGRYLAHILQAMPRYLHGLYFCTRCALRKEVGSSAPSSVVHADNSSACRTVQLGLIAFETSFFLGGLVRETLQMRGWGTAVWKVNPNLSITQAGSSTNAFLRTYFT